MLLEKNLVSSNHQENEKEDPAELHKQWLEEQISLLSQAVRERNTAKVAELVDILKNEVVDVYHETPAKNFHALQNLQAIERSSRSTHQYLGEMVYFGVNAPYRWVNIIDETPVDTILFKDVPLSHTIPLHVRNRSIPSQLGIPVHQASFSSLKYNSELSELYTKEYTDPETGEVYFLERYAIYEASGHNLADPSLFENDCTHRWLQYDNQHSPTYPELSEQQLKDLNTYLGVIRTERAFDPKVGTGSGLPNGLYFTRVYVKEKNPLLVCSISQAVGAVDVVWGDVSEELLPAEMLDLLDENGVKALVEQITSYYAWNEPVHGKEHIRTVLDYLDQLAEDENIDVRTFNLAKLAIAGHDLVRNGRNPAEDSADWIKDILTGLLKPADIQIICDAIIQHNKAPKDRYSETLVTKLLIDADKLDWTKKRYGVDLSSEEEATASDRSLKEQFLWETEMILDGVYFERTKRKLSELCGSPMPSIKNNTEEVEPMQNDWYLNAANLARNIKGMFNRQRDIY